MLLNHSCLLSVFLCFLSISYFHGLHNLLFTWAYYPSFFTKQLVQGACLCGRGFCYWLCWHTKSLIWLKVMLTRQEQGCAFWAQQKRKCKPKILKLILLLDLLLHKLCGDGCVRSCSRKLCRYFIYIPCRWSVYSAPSVVLAAALNYSLFYPCSDFYASVSGSQQFLTAPVNELHTLITC